MQSRRDDHAEEASRGRRRDSRPHSRRDFTIVAVAAAAGGMGALAASLGGGRPRPVRRPSHRSPVDTEAQADVALIGALVDLEQRAIATYSVALQDLRGADARRARDFLAHEGQHAAALTRAAGDLGSAPPVGPAAADYEASMKRFGSRRAALRRLWSVERAALAAYADAVVQVSTEDLRVTCGAILTAEAQHIGALAPALQRPQLTGPFASVRPSP